MSKKRLRNRLEILFSDLAGDDSLPPEEAPAVPEPDATVDAQRSLPVEQPTPASAVPAFLTSWNWEIDENYQYVSCGLEVSDSLRMNPRKFLGQSILTYALHKSSSERLEAVLKGDVFPTEITVLFEPKPGEILPARVNVLSKIEVSGRTTGWRGISQRLPDDEARTTGNANVEKSKRAPAAPSGKEPGVRPVLSSSSNRHGYALEQGEVRPSTQVWTEAGKNSLQLNELVLKNAVETEPAAIAVPMQMQGVGDLLLEIVDDQQEREWSDDDRFLVMEIATQLALALDNAQLYLSVQQELSERIRAEQGILRRNKDLATLNRIGQRLSRLATRDEIFETLVSMIDEMLDHNANLYICSYSVGQGMLSFPVYRENGQPVIMPDRPLEHGIPEHVIFSQKLLLFGEKTAAQLAQAGIETPNRTPKSLLAVPMIAGERTIGVIVLQDFEQENAFDSIHAELLSTAASQATTALENADLFQQMQNALEAIENRERYQANVARSAALLTEFGTKSMPEVLKALGQAAQCSRVYFAHVQEDERGMFWSSTSEWVDPSVAYLFDRTRILHIPTQEFLGWSQSLREKGWVVTQADEDSAEAEFLTPQHIHTTLLLAVPGSMAAPNFVAFDQISHPRAWLHEEINSLRVAADAISNTFVREGLLDQLQVTLDETEGLYKASNRLALANDMQEMVSAVLSSVRTAEINRAILLLFEYDTYNKISQITVGANWYSGRGTPPPPVGTEYLRTKYERFFQTSTPIFHDDILEGQIDKELQETLLHQNIRALAILPLWSGKRQIGILLLQSETKHHFTGRETRTYPPLVDQMAISVENQRLFEQTQIALDETELLYNVSNRIAQAADARDMLSLVTETVMPAGADRASLFLFESDTNGELIDIELVGFHDIKGEYQRVGAHLPVTSLPLVKSLADEPLIITDVHQQNLDTASQKTLLQYHINSACIVPLRSGGRLMGLLNASSRHPTDFTSEDTHLLRIVGNGIAVALEKQRLLRQAQRRALELQTASEIARDTASTLSLDLLLNRIVHMLCDRFNFYHASIFLLDETNTYAVVRESIGEAGQEMKQRNHKLAVGSRSVVGTVTATGEPFIVNDVSQNPMHLPNPLLPETHSEMGMPLKLGSTVIGVIDLQSKNVGAFNQDDVTVLHILADQIAIAIENARAYELSQKAIADMREIDRVKSQFLANMSHELRTPLNSIIGFSRVILKGIDGEINDTQKQDLTAIYNSGQHLLNLINDILDLSKIEAGKMELAFADINLADMINSAMSTAVGLVKDKPIKLNTVIPDNLPLVRADSTRVRQVMINFLSNAAKFTDQGTITVEAQRTTNPQGKSEVMVMVTDSGPGIAPEDQAKLFLPFSQVDDSPTRKTGGTGLGLSICRSLIELHGGRIGLLKSVINVGSTFFFTLPVSVPEPVEEEITPPEAGTNMVLAIDDDPKVINLYERYLKPYGYQVIAQTDPKEAINRAIELKPSAITLDIMMPEKDGWQVLHELKNHPETRDIPIVICSILESQEKGFSMGAADYLVKPFLQEDMINALSRLNRDGQIHEVLLIDDDPGDLRLVQKILEGNNNFHISLAEGGKRGWNMIQTNRPDAIILDLFMPDMSGFTILEKMRSSPHLRNIPVVVLTGADLSPEQHQQLSEFGQAILSKGFLREKELLVLLEESLRKLNPVHLED